MGEALCHWCVEFYQLGVEREVQTTKYWWVIMKLNLSGIMVKVMTMMVTE